jgi:hypothetical protein
MNIMDVHILYVVSVRIMYNNKIKNVQNVDNYIRK